MGGGGETACDMTQGVGVTVRQDVLGDPTAKCLAEISDLIGSNLAEPAPHPPPPDAWNSQPEAQLFDKEVVIKEVLDALPNESAITFTANQLEVLVAGGGPVLADTKTALPTRVDAPLLSTVIRELSLKTSSIPRRARTSRKAARTKEINFYRRCSSCKIWPLLIWRR